MMKIVSGAKSVKMLEQAMGGMPPSGSARAARAALQRHVQEQSASQKTIREEASRLAEPLRSMMLKNVERNDPKLIKSLAAQKASYERRNKVVIKLRKVEKFEAQFSAGSHFWMKVPPYDSAWTSPAGNRFVTANANGNCSMAAQSFGDGWEQTATGVGVWFFAPEDNPRQRIAALMDYSDFWWDSASGYVADNRLTTHLWLWGDTEKAWVGQAQVDPSRSDHVGWFESHGSGGSADSGRLAVDAFAPVRAGRWYQAWLWFDAAIYADGGIWGFAASSVNFAASVPFMVFGSL
jgi:hypothetical protein